METDPVEDLWPQEGKLKISTHKLTLLHWCTQYHFLPHTAPELDRHVVPVAQSAPAVPEKQILRPW